MLERVKFSVKLVNIKSNVWSDHNNLSPDCAHSVRSHYFSAVSECRPESRVSDNKFSRERERVVTEARSSQMSFYLWAGRVSPAGPGVSCSHVFTLWPPGTSLWQLWLWHPVMGWWYILKLSVIIPLHHYAAASVWEVNEIYIYWMGLEWEQDESYFVRQYNINLRPLPLGLVLLLLVRL